MNEELNEGGVVIRECPWQFIGKDLRDVRRILDAAHFVEKGAGWPAPGAWSDQTAACVEGVKCTWAAKGEIRDRLLAGKGEL